MSARPSHIYVLGFTDGVIKVGRTSAIERRTSQHEQHARIRQATLAHSWSFETDQAEVAEHHLITQGHAHLQSLVGEYFLGDFEVFLPKAIRVLERVGIITAPRLGFDEAADYLGISSLRLMEAREFDGLVQHHVDDVSPAYFLVSDLDDWAATERDS